MSQDRIGRARWSSLSREFADSLIPLVVSERSALGFYRALCSRFDVDPTGGESQFGPVEVWLPEGRIRWDRALSSLDYGQLRVVVHENPDFLSTFAFSRPCDGEDEMFGQFPDPIARDTYKPVLPGQLVAPRSYWTVWTTTAPLAHGADTKTGNVTTFRRQRVTDMMTGQDAYVQFLSGNAIRGMWRDLVMSRWLDLIGLRAAELPPVRAHALLSGGSIEKGVDSGGVNLPVRQRARQLCPPWDLLGGDMTQQIMEGRLRCHDAVLVCRENAWMLREPLGFAGTAEELWRSLPEAAECTQLRLMTRHAHRDIPESDGEQMLVNTEHLTVGRQLLHSFQLFGIDSVSGVTASCLSDLLSLFRQHGTVGAQAARGYGNISFEPYQPGPSVPELPSPDVYVDYCAEHREEMRAWALQTDTPAAAPKPANGRSRGRQKVAEEPTL